MVCHTLCAYLITVTSIVERHVRRLKPCGYVRTGNSRLLQKRMFWKIVYYNLTDSFCTRKGGEYMSRTYARNVVCGKYWLIWLLWILSIGMCVGESVAGNGGLSFETRVACQRAIEEVYWKHTIWPEGNTTPKPQLREVISEEELRKKVTETLRMSKALEVIWKQPVEGYQLLAELQRMARDNQESRGVT